MPSVFVVWNFEIRFESFWELCVSTTYCRGWGGRLVERGGMGHINTNQASDKWKIADIYGY